VSSRLLTDIRAINVAMIESNARSHAMAPQ
jgi:hypothetical protein